jgi:hypothetical protein
MPVSQRLPRRGLSGRCETSADPDSEAANRQEPHARSDAKVRPCREAPDLSNLAQGPVRPAATSEPNRHALPSVWLAARVVPWHTFNFIGFGPVYLQAGHPKNQCSCSQAETFGLLRCRIDLSGQAFTFAWMCHSCSSSKVRDERSHIGCRAAEETRSSIERNCRKPAAIEGLP